MRLLLVEDEADIRLIGEMSLRDIGGFEVCCAASGEEALQLAQTFHPEVFLLDVMMPGIDGPTTLAALRKLPEHAHTPVIFITAKVGRGDQDKLRSSGAHGVISKPFDPFELPKLVTRMLGSTAV